MFGFLVSCTVCLLYLHLHITYVVPLCLLYLVDIVLLLYSYLHVFVVTLLGLFVTLMFCLVGAITGLLSALIYVVTVSIYESPDTKDYLTVLLLVIYLLSCTELPNISLLACRLLMLVLLSLVSSCSILFVIPLFCSILFCLYVIYIMLSKCTVLGFTGPVNRSIRYCFGFVYNRGRFNHTRTDKVVIGNGPYYSLVLGESSSSWVIDSGC